jgi:hypothetical protein
MVLGDLKSIALRRIAPILLGSGCLLVGLPWVALAQSGGCGLTLFSGVDREKLLSCWLSNGHAGAWDTWILRINKSKMKLAAAQFVIDYPTYFTGSFDPKRIKLKVDKRDWALQEVKLSREDYVIEIYPEEPVPAGSDVEIVASNVTNPSSPGTFYFNCRVQTPGDLPLLRDIGTWIVSIDY